MGAGCAEWTVQQGFHDGRRRAGHVPEAGDLDFLRDWLGFGAMAQAAQSPPDQGWTQAPNDGFEGCHSREFNRPAGPARDFSFGSNEQPGRGKPNSISRNTIDTHFHSLAISRLQ